MNQLEIKLNNIKDQTCNLVDWTHLIPYFLFASLGFRNSSINELISDTRSFNLHEVKLGIEEQIRLEQQECPSKLSPDDYNELYRLIELNYQKRLDDFQRIGELAKLVEEHKMNLYDLYCKTFKLLNKQAK